MKKENIVRSVVVLTIGVIAPLFGWILLKSLANNSSSAHDPDPWIQGLVDQPQTFARNAPEKTWFKITTKDGEIFWQKNDAEILPLSEIPVLDGKTVYLVEAKGPKAASTFFNFLKERDALKKSLILSSADGFLKDMQFYDANLQLSCGQAYLIRFRMLNQLGIANLMKTNMSAVYLDEELFAGDVAEFVEAFKARRVPVFVGPKSGGETSTDVNILTM